MMRWLCILSTSMKADAGSSIKEGSTKMQHQTMLSVVGRLLLHNYLKEPGHDMLIYLHLIALKPL